MYSFVEVLFVTVMSLELIFELSIYILKALSRSVSTGLALALYEAAFKWLF